MREQDSNLSESWFNAIKTVVTGLYTFNLIVLMKSIVFHFVQEKQISRSCYLHATFTRIIFTCTWRCDCQKNHFLLAVFSFFINPLIISDRTLFDLPWVVGSWPHCLQCCSLRATQGELWQCLHGLWHRQDAALSWNINAHSL